MKTAKVYIKDGKTTVGLKVNYTRVYYDKDFLKFYIKLDPVAAFAKENVLGWMDIDEKGE